MGSINTWEGSHAARLTPSPVMIQVSGSGGLDAVVMVKDVPERQKAPQQQQLAKQWDQHKEQGG